MASVHIKVDHHLVRGKLTPVTIKKGDTLFVEVREHSSTGYLWNPTADHISLTNNTYQNLEEGAVGSGTVRIMEFTAAKSDELTLEYRRPWETMRANKLLTLQVNVEQ